MKQPSAIPKTVAIIPSGGLGLRMGLNPLRGLSPFEGEKKKNYLPLLGRPILAHTIAALEDSQSISSIIIAVTPGDEAFCLTEIVEKQGFTKVVSVVAGGLERQDSVWHAINAIAGDFDIIAVHDGARPLVTMAIIERTVAEATTTGAAICAVRVKDTIKNVKDGQVTGTIPRGGLWSVQTPQAFRAELLIDAFKRAEADGFTGTDESSLVERLGVNVSVVEGSYENIKITTPEDLALARFILESRA